MNIYTYTNQNGGGTFNEYGEVQDLNSGYVVALKGHEKVTKDNEQEVTSTFNSLFTLARSLGAFIGTWKHNDKVYIDLSMHVLSLAKAIEMGKRNKQIAIWDCKNKEEIILK